MKTKLNYKRMHKLGAVHLGELRFTKAGMVTAINNPAALVEPGFYFLVKGKQAIARYFVASTSRKDGFNSVLRNLRKGRTSVDRAIAAEGRVQVYYMSNNAFVDLTIDLEQKFDYDTWCEGQAFTLDNQWLGRVVDFKHQRR